jgi:hypothetical protein
MAFIDAPLSVREAGFRLHAATHAGAFDERGREALLKYILRPPLARTTRAGYLGDPYGLAPQKSSRAAVTFLRKRGAQRVR